MMKIAILALILMQAVAKDGWLKDRKAHILTKENIGPVLLKAHEIKIITFLTQDSRNCQDITILLDIYSDELSKESRQDVKFYEVDCYQEGKMCMEMEVTTPPFIFVFNPEGMAEEEYPGGIYSQEQTLDLIKAAVKKIDQGLFLKKQQVSHMRTEEKPAKEEEAPKLQDTQQLTQNIQIQYPEHNPELPLKDQPQVEVEKNQEPKLELNPNFLEDFSPKETLQDKLSDAMVHQILMNNMKRSRKQKRSYFSLAMGSALTTLIMIIMGVGTCLYLKNILSQSTAIRKVIVGDRIYYSQREDQEKYMASDKDIN